MWFWPALYKAASTGWQQSCGNLIMANRPHAQEEYCMQAVMKEATLEAMDEEIWWSGALAELMHKYIKTLADRVGQGPQVNYTSEIVNLGLTTIQLSCGVHVPSQLFHAISAHQPCTSTAKMQIHSRLHIPPQC